MKFSARLAVVIAFGLFAALPVHAQRGGFGGRMSGGFSGHSFSHSSGHASGRGSRGGAPFAGTIIRRGTVVPMPHAAFVVRPGQASAAGVRPAISSPRVLPAPRRPVDTVPVVRHSLWVGRTSVPLIFDRRFAFFPHHHGFAFSFCSSFFGFPSHHFFLGGFFDCFPERIFFEPFFFEPVFAPFLPIAEPVLLEPRPGLDVRGSRLAEAAAEDASQSDLSATEGALGGGSAAGKEPPSAAKPEAERPLTLLQLQDGSMYGLAEYWIEGDRLHYLTSYGGENSVPFGEIDLEKTVKLNAERGVEFVLRPKPASR